MSLSRAQYKFTAYTRSYLLKKQDKYTVEHHFRQHKALLNLGKIENNPNALFVCTIIKRNGDYCNPTIDEYINSVHERKHSEII